jgi:hypothetical protein
LWHRIFLQLFWDLQFLVHRPPNTCTFFLHNFCRQKLYNFLFYFFFRFFYYFWFWYTKKTYCTSFEISFQNNQVCFYKECQFLHYFNAKKWKIWRIAKKIVWPFMDFRLNLSKKYICLEVCVQKTVGPKINGGKFCVTNYQIKLQASKKIFIF